MLKSFCNCIMLRLSLDMKRLLTYLQCKELFAILNVACLGAGGEYTTEGLTREHLQLWPWAVFVTITTCHNDNELGDKILRG